MPDQTDFQNLPWITKFAGKGKVERRAKERIRFFFPRYLQPNNYTDDKYTARVSELDFSTACRVGAHPVLASRSVLSLSDQHWEAAKELLSAGNTLPPRDFFSIARDALPSDVHSLFEAQWSKAFGPIKEEVSGAESAKLDATLEQVAIATTPADVERKIFSEPIASHLNEHRKTITNSEATHKGKVGQTAGKKAEILRPPLVIISQKFNELVENNAQLSEQYQRYRASFEEFGRQLQLWIDPPTPAKTSAPKSAEAVYQQTDPPPKSETSPSNPSRNPNENNVDPSKHLRTIIHEGGGFGDKDQDTGCETQSKGTQSCSADGVSAAPNHPLPPTESSNTPPANPSQMSEDDKVKSSLGNSPQPNNDGIGRSGPLAARQEGEGELCEVKRKFEATSPPAPQGTQPSNYSGDGEGLGERGDGAHRHKKPCVGTTSRARAICPPGPISASTNSLRHLAKNKIDSSPGNKPQLNEPASIDTPSEQVDQHQARGGRSDTMVGGDGQPCVGKSGSSKLNPHSRIDSALLANSHSFPQISKPLSENSPVPSSQPWHPSPAQIQPQPSALESGIQRKAEEAGDRVGAHTKVRNGGAQVVQSLSTTMSWEEVTGTKRPGTIPLYPKLPRIKGQTQNPIDFFLSVENFLSELQDLTVDVDYVGVRSAITGAINLSRNNHGIRVCLAQSSPLLLTQWLQKKGESVQDLHGDTVSGEWLCKYLRESWPLVDKQGNPNIIRFEGFINTTDQTVHFRKLCEEVRISFDDPWFNRFGRRYQNTLKNLRLNSLQCTQGGDDNVAINVASGQ